MGRRRKEVKEDTALEIAIQYDMDKAPFVWGPMVPAELSTYERYELSGLLARSKMTGVNPALDDKTFASLIAFAKRNCTQFKEPPKHVREAIEAEKTKTAVHQPVHESVVPADPQYRTIAGWDEDYIGGYCPW